ncbi:FecR family protein [Carboxylicivirga sp. N1Y90]|uniref:FecR family protein n=1 Tax=Carboxylicivirga fragile TaxID=3417571 RepID=UPI003D34EFFC|nr:DUF4974 domain-containing protein [Marinilabiliaceae bacterium N1Y90]
MENLEQYIIKELNGTLSNTEHQELKNWLDDSEQNKANYMHYKSLYLKTKEISVYKSIKKDVAWHRINNTISSKKLSIQPWFAYASATVAAAAVIAFVILFIFNTKDDQATELANLTVQPGASKAILETGSGEYLVLDGDNKTMIQSSTGKIIGTDSLDVLSYHNNIGLDKIEFNTIKVPRGGEYQLVLSDGTKVWLNSESELRFPVAFTGDIRQVDLIGEGLFDVKQNKTKPFIVKTEYSKVKVYGTQFNVMSYPDDMLQETTLVEGSVSVIRNGKETIIQPGQQARLDKKSNQMFVNEVDVELYTAWKDGIFRFEEMTLDDMANKLSRWYDVEFFFANKEVRTKRFTGGVRRSTDFKFFMRMIEETTKVEVEMNGKTILVKGMY